MIFFDSWYVYDKASKQQGGISIEDQKQFYSGLAVELIDNEFDVGPAPRHSTPTVAVAVNNQQRQQDQLHYHNTGNPRSGIGPHITPTKRTQVNSGNAQRRNSRVQGRCMECGNKTTSTCSVCIDNGEDGWICNASVASKECFCIHLQKIHNIGTGIAAGNGNGNGDGNNEERGEI